uniref:Uncharacterized protein n=1 Tax=Clytia hemisphaerica TaxID=252671 RepID=A0A7M5V4R1_9CNID|eukprot:TCONS_00057189-protein
MAFINVHYGENERLLINLNCCIGNLVHWIKARSNYRNVDIDLVDDIGTLQNLTTLDSDLYAVDRLKNRNDYILVQIEKDDKNKLTITPLMENLELVNPKLIEKLHEQALSRSKLQSQKSTDLNHASLSSAAVAAMSFRRQPSGSVSNRSQSPNSTTSYKSSRSKKRSVIKK